jgi:hypothetical protein
MAAIWESRMQDDDEDTVNAAAAVLAAAISILPNTSGSPTKDDHATVRR